MILSKFDNYTIEDLDREYAMIQKDVIALKERAQLIYEETYKRRVKELHNYF